MIQFKVKRTFSHGGRLYMAGKIVTAKQTKGINPEYFDDVESKAVDSPPADKMIKSAPEKKATKKRGRPKKIK